MLSSLSKKLQARSHIYIPLVIMILIISTVITAYNIIYNESKIEKCLTFKPYSMKDVNSNSPYTMKSMSKYDYEITIEQTNDTATTEDLVPMIILESSQTLIPQKHYEIANITHPAATQGYGSKVKSLLLMLGVVIIFLFFIFLLTIIR